MYTSLNKVLKSAARFNYTVGAFNMHNLEMLPAMILAAKKQGAPIIIQTSVGTAEYIGHEVIVSVCRSLADSQSVDVVLHLDHCTKFSEIKKAIDLGYLSVMFDGSSLSFQENILRTKEVVAYASARGVSVEAELGTISGSEDGISAEKAYTDPEKAKIFVEETKIDALAVSVGTCHGSYKAKTELNFELIKKLHETVDIPLVIHGGTGVKEEDIKFCVDHGIRKFNVGTELLVGWTKKATEMFNNTKENSSLRNNIVPCNELVSEVVCRKIKLFLNN